jgi:hypothetical protein
LIVTQAHSAAFEVHLIPFKLGDFSEAAAGPIAEDEHGAFVYRQSIAKRLVFFVLPEPLTRALLLQKALMPNGSVYRDRSGRQPEDQPGAVPAWE